MSVRLYLPAPFGRGFLIFETMTVVLEDSVNGVALGVDEADDEELETSVWGISGVGVDLGDGGTGVRGLHLSIADSALSMAALSMSAAIADDSARA